MSTSLIIPRALAERLASKASCIRREALHELRRLLTSPSAPVAVVLPDIDQFIEDDLGLSSRKIASGDYQSFGASCAARAIDKVRELNSQ